MNDLPDWLSPRRETLLPGVSPQKFSTAQISKEKLVQRAQAGGHGKFKTMTAAEKSEMARRGGMASAAKRTPEQKKELGRKAALASHAKRKEKQAMIAAVQLPSRLVILKNLVGLQAHTVDKTAIGFLSEAEFRMAVALIRGDVIHEIWKTLGCKSLGAAFETRRRVFKRLGARSDVDLVLFALSLQP